MIPSANESIAKQRVISKLLRASNPDVGILVAQVDEVFSLAHPPQYVSCANYTMRRYTHMLADSVK